MSMNLSPEALAWLSEQQVNIRRLPTDYNEQRTAVELLRQAPQAVLATLEQPPVARGSRRGSEHQWAPRG